MNIAIFLIVIGVLVAALVNVIVGLILIGAGLFLILR